MCVCTCGFPSGLHNKLLCVRYQYVRTVHPTLSLRWIMLVDAGAQAAGIVTASSSFLPRSLVRHAPGSVRHAPGSDRAEFEFPSSSEF